MGRQDVTADLSPDAFRAYTRQLLIDLRALEQMVCDGVFERGVRRVGVEQEAFLVTRGWRPAPVAMAVLEDLGQEEYSTEIARFNLEMNVPPLDLGAGTFRRLEDRLAAMIATARAAAAEHGADIVLTGILPTLTGSDLSLANLTPRDRYRALNDAMNRASRARYRVYIQGTDEVHLEHDSVMLEGGNTSFQVHLQVDPDEFARMYNVAQAIAAPVLAAAVNSPLLFGRRLWAETRIALFQRAIDTRGATPHVREITPRVRFGERWIRSSVVEILQDNIARIPALLGGVIEEDPFAVLRRGGAPTLEALQIYNSTVYQWNRPCYGVHAGRPHLRIECRLLPAGPTIIDEVANAAFWVGLMLGASTAWGDVAERMAFDDARANFVAAARRGLRAGFTWMGRTTVVAPRLILDELLPLAYEGLAVAGVAADEAAHYLGVIEARVTSGRTGAQWLEQSLTAMAPSGSRGERLAALTAAMAAHQREGTPVHEWTLPQVDRGPGWRENYQRVEQYMTTDLFTIGPDECVDLAALVMDAKCIRQVPVEDGDRRLVGFVTFGAVLRALAARGDGQGVAVSEIMIPAPATIAPETSTAEAIQLMRRHRITCLPVVKHDKLVGLVSVDDFFPIAERLLHEQPE